jgi:hypothetical protein
MTNGDIVEQIVKIQDKLATHSSTFVAASVTQGNLTEADVEEVQGVCDLQDKLRELKDRQSHME